MALWRVRRLPRLPHAAPASAADAPIPTNTIIAATIVPAATLSATISTATVTAALALALATLSTRVSAAVRTLVPIFDMGLAREVHVEELSRLLHL